MYHAHLISTERCQVPALLSALNRLRDTRHASHWPVGCFDIEPVEGVGPARTPIRPSGLCVTGAATGAGGRRDALVCTRTGGSPSYRWPPRWAAAYAFPFPNRRGGLALPVSWTGRHPTNCFLHPPTSQIVLSSLFCVL